MSIKFNKKGMTLVEITVVLLIASILMTITGGILINSLGYFQDTTALSTDKSVGDGILDFINSEIEYSSDARIQENQPGGNDWHSIYVENGQLYRDGVAVFDEDYYYNKRKLEINVNGFKNGYRLDMKIYLKKNNEIKYRTSHTFEFLNLKKTKKADSTYNPFNNVLSKVSVVNEINTEKDNEKYRIWYKRDYSEIKPEEDKKDEPTDTDQTRDGTVADIRFNIDVTNYWGVFYSSSGRGQIFKKGDIVWYNNSWWERMEDDNNVQPGTDYRWKKLSSDYDAGSAYEYGDIINYDHKYYKAILPLVTWQKPGDPYNVGWEEIKDINEVKQKTYTKKNVRNVETVVKKYFTDNISVLLDTEKKDYKEFSSDILYKDGDIVKMKNKYDESFYDLWIKKANFPNKKDDNKAPGSPDSGWVKIDLNFDETSSYVEGDIVACKAWTEVGSTEYIIAKQNVLTLTNPLTDIYNPKEYWSVLLV